MTNNSYMRLGGKPEWIDPVLALITLQALTVEMARMLMLIGPESRSAPMLAACFDLRRVEEVGKVLATGRDSPPSSW